MFAFGLAVGAGLFVAGQGMAEGVYPVPKLPSGLAVEVLDKFLDVKADGELTFGRFRFLAPELPDTAAMAYEVRLKDMDVLCADYALPHVKVTPDPVDRIVISISDKPIKFGETAPGVVQFFEVYRIENGACIWEEF
ncbi:DUF6497 family protein [Rhodobacteraceae bacterium D3-12]|nr:DUF6497 family protein [Rhodobacteraceae bacterium D3-12]